MGDRCMKKIMKIVALGIVISLLVSFFSVAATTNGIEELTEDGFSIEAEEGSTMYVLVNSTVYEPLLDDLEEYKEMVENAHDLSVEVIENGFGDHTEIRDYLKEGYENEGLEGVFFVGNLPYAEFEISDDFGDGIYERFPIDHYYADLNGEWTDTNESGAYDRHEPGDGDLDPQIWLGRLSMKTDWAEEIELYRNYFEKVREYRKGELTVDQEGLLYIDDDWVEWTDQYEEGMLELYDNV